MWREQDYLEPRALLGYFPCNADGNELIIWDPEAPGERELTRLVFPRQPRHDRICLADFYRPLRSGAGPQAGADVVAIQAVTAGARVTELMASLEASGEFAEQLFVHGLGVQCAEAMAESMHARVRAEPESGPGRDGATGGLPGVPRPVRAREGLRAAGTRAQSGCGCPAASAVEPEQSTLAIIAHHPQAVYFGMRSGSLPKTPPATRG